MSQEQQNTSPTPQNPFSASQRFDLNKIAASFPDHADTMLLDTYLKDSPEASVRVFRVYHPIPPHYHTQCDEVLQVLSGKGSFWINDPSDETEFAPGQLIIFPKRAVHSVPRFTQGPVTFLAIDTPRRAPDDVTFVNPEDGQKRGFIAQV